MIIQRLLAILSFVISIYMAYKYRYKVMNVFLKRRWLGKLAVSIAMQIPFIRDKVLGAVSQYRRPQNV